MEIMSCSKTKSSDLISAAPVKENNPLTTAVHGLHQERETRFELATSSQGSKALLDVSVTDKELTATPLAACTTASTSEQETTPLDSDLALILEHWPNLSEPLRAGILAMVKAAIKT